MTPLRAGTAVLLAGLLLTAGCTKSDEPPDTTGGVFHDPFVPTGELRLVAYESCDEAAEQLRAATRRYVGPWGLAGSWGFGRPGAMPADGAEDAASAGEGAPAAPPAGPDAARAVGPDSGPGAAPDPDTAQNLQGAPDPAAPAHSGTNVHEAGVDEPDLVKTDGRRIVTVSQGKLRVVDAARRVETGSLDLFPAGADPALAAEYRWAPADLLLSGDRALVLFQDSYLWLDPEVSTRPATRPEPLPIAGPRLLLVDLTGAPQILSEYTIDGSLIDARSVGQTARVVVRSGPRLAMPEPDPGLDEDEQLAANQAAVDAADLSDWLPRYELTVDGDTSTGQVECTSMSRPASYTGTSMVTVLTFDLTQPAFGDGAPVTVVADGETVYSNGPSLYVANDQRWQAGWMPMPMPRIEDDAIVEDDAIDDKDVEDEVEPEVELDDRTVIHKFDTSDAGPPRYVASGSVEGWLINQYAMSEWDGHLRVATTSGETWWAGPGESAPTSESTVYVLAERDGELVEVGSVGGLGEGERIYSVRFAGPVGYVVTFRETDPLYTVDLRDPAAPAVLGELKITGYSAYLHPIDAGRLIGVGQEADLQGRTQGTQVSLFDVSDLTDPRLQAQHHVRYGHSEAEFDPHAFLWWPAERLLVLPLTSYEGASGVLLLRVDGDTLTELELISHPATGPWDGTSQIRRSLVIEDTLWTVSEAGLAAHSLSTLDRVAWLPA